MDSLFPTPVDEAEARFPAAPLTIDAGRLCASLSRLARFGPHPDGGARRIAFSKAELRARRWLIANMKGAGLSVRTDAAGNVFGRREGREDLPAILFGSHLDTVPRGGHFDGALGVMAALETVGTLGERGIRTRRPLEMVVWCDEEGAHFGNGLFGSRAATGAVHEEELHRVDEEGVSLHEWMERYRLKPGALGRAVLDPKDFHAAFELHIEQGGNLDRDGVRLGIVEGIVGIHRFEARIRGFQNHAGTTPMAERNDALLTAARLIVAVHQEIRAVPGEQVGNVGQIDVSPAAANVVPGAVRFPIELRDLEDRVVDDVIARIRGRAAKLAAETGCAIETARTLREPPAWMDPGLCDLLRREAAAVGEDPLPLPSRAGHDSQNTARHGIPTAMIFVPSRDGISHAPREWTSASDCARGADLLFRAVAAADRA